MRNLSAVLVLTAALAGCSSDPVDRELVGTWQTAITSPVGAWQLRFTTLSNGQYRTDFFGPFLVPAETGYFTADDGEWRIEKIAGSIEEGSYEFLSDDSVLFRAPSGAVVWNRVTGTAAAAAAAALPAPAAPGFGAPSGFGAAPGVATQALGGAGDSASAAAPSAPFGVQPTQRAAAPGADGLATDAGADLLATGPFGSAPAAQRAGVPFGAALPQTDGPAPFGAGAVGTAFAPTFPAQAGGVAGPFGTVLPGGPAPGGAAASSAGFMPPGMPVPPAPFGIPKAAPSDVFSETVVTTASGSSTTSSFGAQQNYGGPRNVGVAVGGVQRDLESTARELGNLPQQTVNDLERGAQQAAAQAIDQAAAPVTDAADEATHKASQRVQKFTNNAASKFRNFFTGGKNKNDEADSAKQEDR